jgi:hypothetical protein
MYDPILLKKIAQIYTEADNAFLSAFESAAERVLRERRPPIEEEPRFLALANEFGLKKSSAESRALLLHLIER